MYLVNGDHNHMASAIEGVIAGHSGTYSSNTTPTPTTTPTTTRPTPVAVVYVDLHADSRPVEDGPHSGTWCSEALAKQQIEKVGIYVNVYIYIYVCVCIAGYSLCNIVADTYCSLPGLRGGVESYG